MSSGFEVYLPSNYDASGNIISYQRMFPTNVSANDDLSAFLGSFPQTFNVHVASWYSTIDGSYPAGNSYPIQSSSILSYKYTDSLGQVEE